MQACRTRSKRFAFHYHFNPEYTTSHTNCWFFFSLLRVFTCSVLMIILAMVATPVAMGIPTSPRPVVHSRTSALELSNWHTPPCSTATQTPAVVSLGRSQQPVDTHDVLSIKKLCATPLLADQGSVSTRKFSEISQGQVLATPVAKKRKVVCFSSATVSVPVASNSTCLPSSAPTPRHPISPAAPVPPLSCNPLLSPKPSDAGRQVRTQTTGTSSKRFKPLKIMQPAAEMPGDPENARISLGLQGDESARTMAQLSAITHWHLDFPAPMAPPALSPISLPPSLAERRLVQPWAIILSGLSAKERLQCCFVSKLFRYAGKRHLP